LLFCQLIWLKVATREQDKSTSSSRLVAYTQQIHKMALDAMSQLTYIDLDKILAPISNCTICDEVITTAEVARIVCHCKDERYFCSDCLCNWRDSCGLQFPPKEASCPVCRMGINSREVRRGDGPTVLRSREELLALEIQVCANAKFSL
jgi:hypothetical protein